MRKVQKCLDMDFRMLLWFLRSLSAVVVVVVVVLVVVVVAAVVDFSDCGGHVLVALDSVFHPDVFPPARIKRCNAIAAPRFCVQKQGSSGLTGQELAWRSALTLMRAEEASCKSLCRICLMVYAATCAILRTSQNMPCHGACDL